MTTEESKRWNSLGDFVTAWVKSELDRGSPDFKYEGARLFPEEVTDMLLPSIMCMTQNLMDRVGGEFGKSGFEFDLDFKSNEAFPLVAKACDSMPPLHIAVVFMTQVLEGENMDFNVSNNRSDVARIFERAAQMIHPGFSLDRNTRVERNEVTFNSQQPEPRV